MFTFQKIFKNILFIISVLSITYTIRASELTSDDVFYSESYPDLSTLEPKQHQNLGINRWSEFKNTVIRQALFLLNLYPNDTLLVYGRDGEIIYDALKYLSHLLFNGNHKIHLINFSRKMSGMESFSKETYSKYLSQYGLNEANLENGERFILVDTGYSGTLQKFTVKLFDEKYYSQLYVELLMYAPVMFCAPNEDLVIYSDEQIKSFYNRFPLMVMESFLPFTHPHHSSSKTRRIAESLPHNTDTAHALVFNTKTSSWDSISKDSPLEEKVLSRKVREDFLQTIINDTGQIKGLNHKIQKVMDLYYSEEIDLSQTAFNLETLKTDLDAIALIQDLDERFPNEKKRLFFESFGVFFTDLFETFYTDSSKTIPISCHPLCVTNVFEKYPNLKEHFLNLLKAEEFHKVNDMLMNIGDLVFFITNNIHNLPETILEEQQLLSLKITLSYFKKILPLEQFSILKENTLLKDLIIKHGISE